MSSMSVSRLALAVSWAFSLTLPAFADETITPSSDNIEVVEVNGSQVELGDAFAGGQVARAGRVGLLGNLDYMDTPFASSNFTEELIRNQQAISVADVLQNDPVVRTAKGFGNGQELYMIRGFATYSDDMTYNGVYGVLPRQFVAAEMLERVEVFRGANSFINGAAPGTSGLGGTVNLVPKRAGDTPLTQITAGLEGKGQAYLALDTARRFGEDNSTGIRINAVKRDGETAIDNEDQDLSVLSVGLDYRSDKLRLSADFGFQDNHVDGLRPQVTPSNGIPDAPDADTNFGQKWTYSDERQVFGAVRGEYQLTDNISAWLAFGMRDGEENNRFANPGVDADGNTSFYRADNARKDDVWSIDAGVSADFTLATTQHRVILSASNVSIESGNAYAWYNYFNQYSSNLYTPTQTELLNELSFAGGDMDDPAKTSKSVNRSVALADMISLMDDKLLLTLGARLQNIESLSYSYGTPVLYSSYDESRVTPALGAVYKYNDQLSVYANYAEGLVPGETAPTDALNSGEILDPFKSDQQEIGVKYDGGMFGATVSVFSITQASAILDDDNYYRANGEQRNQGLELTIFGMPAENIRIIGGLTLLDAELNNTEDGVNEGNNAIGVADTQANLNLEWDIAAVPGLTLDARAVYTGSQYADEANTMKIDSWTRFDLGARYQTQLADFPLTVRARVENLTDDNYWASVGGYPGSNYLVLSAPRSISLSATLAF